MVDIDFFKQNGYQIFENVIPLEMIEEIRTILQNDATKSLHSAMREIGCDDESNVIDYIQRITNGTDLTVSGLTKHAKDTLSGHISLQTRMNPALQKIPYHPTIQSILKALLNTSGLNMHMPPTARFILPQNIHSGVPAHQDIVYNRHMSNFITMWVPLVNIDEECGGVVMYEGSGNIPELPTNKGFDDLWFEGVPTEGFKPKHCAIQPGSALFLNKYIIHASKPNISGRVRYSIDYRFFESDAKSTKHYLDMQSNMIIQPS